MEPFFADISLKASTKSQWEEENEEEDSVFHFKIFSSVPSNAILWLERFAVLDNNNYFSWHINAHRRNFTSNFFNNILRKQGVCLSMKGMEISPSLSYILATAGTGTHLHFDHFEFIEDAEEVFLRALEMRKDANHGPTGLTFEHPQPFQSTEASKMKVHRLSNFLGCLSLVGSLPR